MTAQEHKLVVLQSGDVDAFEALVRAQESSDRQILQAVVSQYEQYARELGLQNQLPQLGKP